MITVGDLIVRLVQDRDQALATADPAERQDRALDVLQDAMFIMHKVLGEDLIKAALGQLDGKDRVVVLETIGRRLHALSGIFGRMPDDAAAPFKVVEEALAVARGDAPLLFAKIAGQKVNDRVARAKLEALRWDRYLQGRGLSAHDRRPKIEQAFGHGWETIRRGWHRDVVSVLGDEHVTYQLNLAAAEGRRGTPRWEMLTSTDWEAALDADGARFLQVQRENNGNR